MCGITFILKEKHMNIHNDATQVSANFDICSEVVSPYQQSSRAVRDSLSHFAVRR